MKDHRKNILLCFVFKFTIKLTEKSVRKEANKWILGMRDSKKHGAYTL